MGLDSYWVDSEGKAASVEGDFNIAGGMMSGHGNDSFRGKRYSDFVEEITGVSLYQELIPAPVVKGMAEKLSDLNSKSMETLSIRYDIDLNEVKDVVQMFRLHADADHGLKGWW